MMNTEQEAHGFDWFDPEQTARIAAQLQAAGDGARLEIHRHGEGVIVYVVPAPDTVVAFDGGGTNNSYRCPPVCP
jgi:uncharacterized protein (DUF1684 family)